MKKYKNIVKIIKENESFIFVSILKIDSLFTSNVKNILNYLSIDNNFIECKTHLIWRLNISISESIIFQVIERAGLYYKQPELKKWDYVVCKDDWSKHGKFISIEDENEFNEKDWVIISV